MGRSLVNIRTKNGKQDKETDVGLNPLLMSILHIF